jgi:hypothetical protein
VAADWWEQLQDEWALAEKEQAVQGNAPPKALQRTLAEALDPDATPDLGTG